MNDVTPPTLASLIRAGSITVSATDAGSGVDPSSITATSTASGEGYVCVRDDSDPGEQREACLVLSVADFQEAKNMEDVPPILPNTTTLSTTVRVTRSRLDVN